MYTEDICLSKDLIDDFICFYNNEQEHAKTGVAPLTLRHSVIKLLFSKWGFRSSVRTNWGQFTETDSVLSELNSKNLKIGNRYTHRSSIRM